MTAAAAAPAAASYAPAIIGGVASIAGGLLGGGGRAPDPAYSYGESFGSSFNRSGSSQSSQSWQNPDSVWGVQSPYLQGLYGAASNIFDSGGNQQAATDMWNMGSRGLNDLLNPGANPLMEVYQQQMQQGLEQNILPTIRREAAGYNAVGGTRHGISEGMALQQAQREQSQFAAQLYNQDRDRMLGAATQVPGMMGAGLGIPWYGANQLAGILGPPTVLGGGGGSIGSGSSFGLGGSEQSAYSISGPDGDNPYAPPGRIPDPGEGEESPGFKDNSDRWGNN